MEEKIAAEELAEELEAMLKVCFEGEVSHSGDEVCIQLPNGQKFSIECRCA